MMMAPEKLVRIIGYSKKRQPHQRRFGDLEALPSIFDELILKTLRLFGLREITPVVQRERQFHFSSHYLKRFLQVVPYERGPQNRVPFQNTLPGSLERVDVQPFQSAADLGHIDSAFRRKLAVKRHAFLKRSNRIDVFYVLIAHSASTFQFNFEQRPVEIRLIELRERKVGGGISARFL